MAPFLASESLWVVLGAPPTRLPVDATTLAWFVLPPVACYFIAAVLAVTPNTGAIRVALWPIITLLALRAAVSVEMSLGKPEHNFLNIDLAVMFFSITLSSDKPFEGKLTIVYLQLGMVSIVARSLDWALAKEPLKRSLRSANGAPSTILDALDLALNLRGYGWDWSHGLKIPRETRPTNRMAFTFYASLSAFVHAWICGACHRAVVTFTSPNDKSIPNGFTIFDETLPFFARYLRSSTISVFTALSIYSVLQMSYDLCTVFAVLFARQDPAQWPPAFDAPWCATSLIDFWGRRWHQWFRRTFVLSSYPLSLVLGRAGILLGAFLSSAVFHHIAGVALNSEAEIWRMLVGFGMMGVGILVERTFRQLTGRRVCGVIGWVWTMAWLVLWGNVIVEGFARSGMFSCSSPIDSKLPVRVSVERLVIAFDRWLHTI